MGSSFVPMPISAVAFRPVEVVASRREGKFGADATLNGSVSVEASIIGFDAGGCCC